MSSPYQYPPSAAGGIEPGSGSLAEAMEARRRLTEGVAYVYVPTQPSDDSEADGPREVRFELRLLADGTGALPVFTERELLIEQLGQHQPWERMAVLELLMQISAEKLPVVVNPVVQPDADRWTAERIEEWRRTS